MWQITWELSHWYPAQQGFMDSITPLWAVVKFPFYYLIQFFRGELLSSCSSLPPGSGQAVLLKGKGCGISKISSSHIPNPPGRDHISRSHCLFHHKAPPHFLLFILTSLLLLPTLHCSRKQADFLLPPAKNNKPKILAELWLHFFSII